MTPFIALQRGLFRAQGLDVTPVILGSGEASTQELLSGKLQFAFSNYVTAVLAASEGAKLRIVADGAQTLPGTNVLMIEKNSAIRGVPDLRGKTIAVNALGNIGSLMVDSTLRTYGVPVNSVKFKVIAFPSMAAALADHSVDGPTGSLLALPPAVADHSAHGPTGSLLALPPAATRAAPDADGHPTSHTLERVRACLSAVSTPQVVALSVIDSTGRVLAGDNGRRPKARPV